MVTDLGTEFGVWVSQRAPRSHVSRGRIRPELLWGAATDGKAQGVAQVLQEQRVGGRIGSGQRPKTAIHLTTPNPPDLSADCTPKRVPIKLFNTGLGLKEGEPDPHWQIVA